MRTVSVEGPNSSGSIIVRDFPLEFTAGGYPQELRDQHKSGALPKLVTDLAEALIDVELKAGPLPPAPDELVKLAREHLNGGIVLRSLSGTRSFSLRVFVPHADPFVPNPDQKNLSSFFKLIEYYPGGFLKDIWDF